MKRFYFIYLLLLLIACDHGINPNDIKSNVSINTGISGTVFYKNWKSPQNQSPQDSLYNLKIVVFKNYPPSDIVFEVSSGDAIAYPAELDKHLPYYVDSTNFEINLPAREYEYIVVAQQYGAALFIDWRAVGQYDTTISDSIPTTINVLADSVLPNINIYVDFDSLPGQPF